jgi:acyl-CoA thioesterase-2
MPGLHEHTAIREEDGRRLATLDRAWEIWGPDGGYMASIALRAAGLDAPDGHRPISLKCQYLNVGRFEEAEVRTEALKRGRTAACTRVDLVQGAKTTLTAEVWTTSKDDGPILREHEKPKVPRPNDLVTRPQVKHHQSGHRFWDNFEVRPVKQRVLGVPDPRGARLQTWYRYNDFPETSDPFLDYARAIVLIDTLLWPTFVFSQPQPLDYYAPSLDLSVWLHEPPGPRDWLLLDARTDTVAGGVIFGDARVWTDDGRLVATGASQMLVTPIAKPGAH